MSGHRRLGAVRSASRSLSSPGLRAEAAEQRLPLEVVEYQAVRAAASDIAQNYKADERRMVRRISAILASYSE